MASVMEMFRNVINPGAGAAPAVVAVSAAPKEPASVTANTLVPSSATPQSDGSVKAIPAAGEGDASPLDGYKDFWQAPDPKTAKNPASLVPTFSFDPKAIQAEAAKLNFTSSVDPELMKKATGGDQEALLQIVNQASQGAFAAAMGTSAKLVEAAMTKQTKAFHESVMPDILRRNSINTELREEIPLFENPAVAPLLKSVETQLATRYTTATPAEITAKAKDFLKDFATEVLIQQGKVVSEKPAVTAAAKRGKTTDWDAYMNGTATS